MSNLIPTQENDMEISEKQGMVPININMAEIDIQIATAHRFPRSITKFKEQALEIATMDEETAASCFYVIPRGGENIDGPGVRLAEIVGSVWGNMRYGARIVGEDDKFVTAQGGAFDLEKNVAVTIEVKRRIADKFGKKYSADMIANTANAACSIALRNAIFRVIPRAFIQSIYEAAKKAAVGDIQTLAGRRQKMLDHFGKMGVSKEKIFAAMGVSGIDDINLQILEKLIGISTAIKDGDLKIDDAFPSTPQSTEPLNGKNKTENLLNKIKEG